MKINDYLELTRIDKDVCYDIERYLDGEDMKKYGDIESLIDAADNVIDRYRSLVSSLFNKINIEDCVKNK